MKNFGFTEEEAKHIESRYHELYKVSDKWVADQLKQATKDGYVTCAFGLRVRTPLLKQVVKGTAKTPKEAEAEGRTAGNALGQSWCLLTNRAAIEFNGEVRNSQYKYDIKPVAHIHDAQYFLIKDDINTLLWANEHLVKAVSWQDDPVIYHPQVHLGGEFSIFWPNWSHEICIPNKCSSDELISIVKDSVE
nr:MAG TPA: DNA polymerase [Caudoviricetes sp.]